MIDHFKQRKRPDSLEGKFTFTGYELLRDFLDGVAEDCEQLDRHPNISFGRDYASIMIYPIAGELGDAEHELARCISQRYEQMTAEKRIENG